MASKKFQTDSSDEVHTKIKYSNYRIFLHDLYGALWLRANKENFTLKTHTHTYMSYP